MVSPVNYFRHIHKIFQNIEKLPEFFYEVSITMDLTSDKDIKRKTNCMQCLSKSWMQKLKQNTRKSNLIIYKKGNSCHQIASGRM